ncbi:hypothetical protein [Streptomyces sp. RTd22]|nr:hypothetical protein [Streptomyces sp. RTd22]
MRAGHRFSVLRATTMTGMGSPRLLWLTTRRVVDLCRATTTGCR